MAHQFDVMSTQKLICSNRSVRTRIVMMENDPSSAVGFLYFLEYSRQTNGNALMAYVLRKKDIICKFFVCKQFLFDTNHLDRPIRPIRSITVTGLCA